MLSLQAEELALFTTQNTEVSSANSLTFVVRPKWRSLMQMGKIDGPKTEPSGSPAVTDFHTEDWPLKTTLWHLFFKNYLMSLRRLLLTPLLLSLSKRPSCQTLSNDLDRSKKTPQISNQRLASKALKMFCVIAISWYMQGSLGLNPDWLLLEKLFLSRKSQILSKVRFSKVLEQMGKRDTEL